LVNLLVHNSQAYSMINDLENAFTFATEAFEMSQRLYSEDRLERAKATENLGQVLFCMKEYQKALHYFHQADSLLRIVFKKEEAAEIGVCLGNIGAVYEKLDDADNALLCLTQSNDILKKLYAANKVLEHPRLAKSYTRLAEFYSNRNDSERTVRYASLAYETMRKVMGDEHPSLIDPLFDLAKSHEDSNDIDRALYYMEKYDSIFKMMKSSKRSAF
jgi:tetratricopeptide (TPR) repeat protein